MNKLTEKELQTHIDKLEKAKLKHIANKNKRLLNIVLESLAIWEKRLGDAIKERESLDIDTIYNICKN